MVQKEKKSAHQEAGNIFAVFAFSMNSNDISDKYCGISLTLTHTHSYIFKVLSSQSFTRFDGKSFSINMCSSACEKINCKELPIPSFCDWGWMLMQRHFKQTSNIFCCMKNSKHRKSSINQQTKRNWKKRKKEKQINMTFC